jgi:CubicO group peptidase (beta-lactamase class C family)
MTIVGGAQAPRVSSPAVAQAGMGRASRLLCSLAFLLAFGTSAAARAGLSVEQKAAIDALSEHYMAAAHVPSIVVLIDQGGETIYSGTFGTANIAYDLKPSIDTPYAIGSITKSFTALAVLQLVHGGQIDLEAPVSAYLDDYDGPAASVPVRRLLDHTNGIPNYTNDIPELRTRLERDAFSRDQMLDTFRSLPLEFTPGDRFDYTNSGYYLLGLIVEAVSGQDYYEHLRENVFVPLDMTHTYSGDRAEIIELPAGGYDITEAGYANAPPWSHLVPFSAGSLISTARDVVRYRRGVFHSDHFPAALRELVISTRPMNDGTENIYSLGGLVIGESDGYRKYAHAGDIWGFTADHAYYPTEDLTIVIVANRQVEAPAISSLEQKVARVVFGIAQPEIRDLVLGEDELDRYAGNYDLHPFVFGPSRYGFIARDGKLHLRFGGVDAGGPVLPLLAQGHGVFRASFDDEWVFSFHPQNEGKRALRLESDYRDGTFHARRSD